MSIFRRIKRLFVPNPAYMLWKRDDNGIPFVPAWTKADEEEFCEGLGKKFKAWKQDEVMGGRRKTQA